MPQIVGTYKDKSLLPNLSEREIAFTLNDATFWISISGQIVKMEGQYLVTIDFKDFIDIYKPDVDNISSFLCDNNREVRTHAKKWYEENMVKNDN